MRGAVVLFALIAGTSAFAEPSPVQTKESRIVSGWEAAEGQFPYMLYVRGVTQVGTVSSCGGSVIHRRWGLSSGKCTSSRAYLIISGGMVNLSRPRFTFETSTVITAPEFIDAMHPVTQPHDIALIGFERDLTFDNYVKPIRIQRSSDRRRDYSGVLMSTSGWGTTWSHGETTENLNWVHLVGVTNFVCLLMINSNYLVQETTICAGPYNVTSQSICSGDSGVPLTLIDDDGELTQVGVGSFVVGWGCHVGFPAGFIRPGFYHDWIRETTGIDFDWDLNTKHDDNGDGDNRDDTANVEQVKIVEGLMIKEQDSVANNIDEIMIAAHVRQ